MLHQIIWNWYTGSWWVGCYIWYSKEGPGRAVAPPSPLLAVPNVRAHPSTASVPIILLLYDGPLLCGFNVAIKGLTKSRRMTDRQPRAQAVNPSTLLTFCHSRAKITTATKITYFCGRLWKQGFLVSFYPTTGPLLLHLYRQWKECEWMLDMHHKLQHTLLLLTNLYLSVTLVAVCLMPRRHFTNTLNNCIYN